MKKNKALHLAIRGMAVITVLFLFLLSLKLMGNGFKLMSKDLVDQVFSATENPFVALFIGLFATALMQSSSTSTSIIVTLVASEAISVGNAVPMIMGANIGTSVTSTIVAMGHIHKKEEFKDAIGAATVHDFFNIIVVLILLPFELATGYLSKSAEFLASLYPVFNEGSDGFSLMGATINPLAKTITYLLKENVLAVLITALILLVISLRYFSKLLRSFLIGQSQKVVDKYVFGHPLNSLFWGAAITAGVQSSSVTASLTVPFVATKRASLENIFPFLIGANVGTTITALIAALSQNETALSIAICHVIFNLVGVMILFPIKSIRNIPIWLASKLGAISYQYRLVGVAYVIIVFFLIPFMFIFFQ